MRNHIAKSTLDRKNRLSQFEESLSEGIKTALGKPLELRYLTVCSKIHWSAKKLNHWDKNIVGAVDSLLVFYNLNKSRFN